MTIRIAPLPATVIVCGALVAFSFVAAPRSCQWGLPAYGWAGVAAIAIVMALPFFPHHAGPVGRRVLHSISLGSIVAVAWTAGLLAANVRIICRLM